MQLHQKKKNTRVVLSEKMRSNFCCSFLGLITHPQACPVLEEKVGFNLRLEHSMKYSHIVFHFK